MERSVVVTAVSSGIGWGIADVLLKEGFKVFGTVRKQADGDRLRTEFGSGFTPLVVDVTNQQEVLQAAEKVNGLLGRATLAGLVNNAGISLVGPLLHQPLEDFRKQLEVNLIGPLQVVQAFGPLLGADRTREGSPGRIVNISSVGGRMGAPFLGTYAATKHGLEGLSESLRRELQLYGIDVILVEPGYVNTPILDKAESEDFGIYAKTDYGVILDRFAKGFIASGRKGLTPQVVGEAVHRALTVRRPKVVYTILKQKFQNWTLPRLLPKRVVDRILGTRLGILGTKNNAHRH